MRVRATRLSATGGHHARPRGLDIAALFAAAPGRVGCYYGTKGGPSYSDIIRRNHEALGPELVVNGGFDSESGWALSAEATVSGGKLSFTGTSALRTAVTSAQLQNYSVYLVSYSVDAVSGAGVRAVLYGGSANIAGATRTTPGPFTEILKISNPGGSLANSISVQAVSSGVSAVIDNVSVREIVDWSKLVLFDDPNGTVPVFSVFQSSRGRGLLLDCSKGLVRGPELVSTASIQGVAVGGPAVTYYSAATSPINTGEWCEVVFEVADYSGTGTVGMSNFDAIRVSANGPYRFIVQASNTAPQIQVFTRSSNTCRYSQISVKRLPGNHMVQPTAAARGEFSARYNELTGTEVLSTQSVTVTAISRTLRFSGPGSITLSGAATGSYTAGTHTITPTAGTLTLTVSGSVTQADLRLTADAIASIPTYQRVTSATDYDTEGFPVYHREQTDDWGRTRVNPAGATKAVVLWAGQKMSDASVGVGMELSGSSPANPGTLALFMPAVAAAPSITGRSRGNGASADATRFSTPAPTRTAVLYQASIPDFFSELNVNGGVANSTLNQGAGPYLEYDVFFGARSGTSLHANRRTFAPEMVLFMQPGDPGLTASQLTALQKRFAKAVGVTL